MDYIFERCRKVLAGQPDNEYCRLVEVDGVRAAVYTNCKPHLALIDGQESLTVLHNVPNLILRIGK